MKLSLELTLEFKTVFNRCEVINSLRTTWNTSSNLDQVARGVDAQGSPERVIPLATRWMNLASCSRNDALRLKEIFSILFMTSSRLLLEITRLFHVDSLVSKRRSEEVNRIVWT